MDVKGGLLVVTYWPCDSGIFNSYALPYVRILRKQLGPERKIVVVTLSPRGTGTKEIRARLAAEGIQLVDFRYRPFGVLMALTSSLFMLSLVRLIVANRIGVIHAWCTPGGAIGYLLSRLTGRALVLDSFEPHAESMVETGAWKPGGFSHRLLLKLEKLQLRRASEVICAAPGMPEHARNFYGVDKPRWFIKPACVDLELFGERYLDVKKNSVITCVYAGKFGDIYLEQEVFDFFKVCYDHWHGNFRALLLTGHDKRELQAMAARAGFPGEAMEISLVPHGEVPAQLARGHFAISPVRPVPSKKYCSPIKDGEYWALGLPVVITKDISEDSELIKQYQAGYVLKSLSQQEYERAVSVLTEIIGDASHHVRIRSIAQSRRNFRLAQEIYRVIYG